jgi:TAT-translocated FGD2 family F420-dependent dehydrogenase
MRLFTQQQRSTNAAVNRRTLLKAAGLFVGASMLSKSTVAGQMDTSGTHAGTPPAIGQKMIGFMLAHEQFPVPELVELGIAAEQAGFDLLATSDHLQPWQSNEAHCGEAWVTMGALGARTKHVWMGPTVTCPAFRYNPAVVAEAFATLSQLYPGRIFLGIGSGEALNEEAAIGAWPKWPERSERLIEATDIIRQLWKGQQIQHKGKYYNVNAKLYDPPANPIPILMAANGPKAMRRSGQYGDGVVTDPKTWSQHKSEFEEGAKAAGKNPSQMPVLVEQFVAVGDQKSAEPAAELWRFLPKAFKTYYNIRDPFEIQKRAEAELPLPQIISDWTVSTDPDVHAKKINDLFNSGVTIVNIHSGQADQKRVIDFYGNNVLPKVRKQMKAA